MTTKTILNITINVTLLCLPVIVKYLRNKQDLKKLEVYYNEIEKIIKEQKEKQKWHQ